jgi:hypothetical protein
MSRSNARISIPAAITIVAVAVIAFVVSGALRPPTVTGATPSGSPTATPAPPATPAPTPVSIYDFADNTKLVKLDIATNHDVFVIVEDETGSVVDARTGHAAEGMSVGWHDIKVENVGPSTLRLTWVGFAVSDKLVLKVGELDGKVELTLVQADPAGDVDATGHDRVLDIEFGSPINAADVLHSLQGSLDTAD